MAMTQTQLADAVAEKAGLSRADAKKAITALEDVVVEQIGKAEKVKSAVGKDGKPKKAKKPSDKTQKIAAATKAKRARKKQADV